MQITSFFICTKTQSILTHNFHAQSECHDEGVLRSWIPEFAAQGGLNQMDFLGGYVYLNLDAAGEEWVFRCDFDSVEIVNDYFEVDCSQFKTKEGLDLSGVISICKQGSSTRANQASCQ